MKSNGKPKCVVCLN